MKKIFSIILMVTMVATLFGALPIVSAADVQVFYNNLDSYELGSYNTTSDSVWSNMIGEIIDSPCGAKYGKSIKLTALGNKLFTKNNAFSFDGSQTGIIEVNVFYNTMTSGTLVPYFAASDANSAQSSISITQGRLATKTVANQMGNALYVINERESTDDSIVITHWINGDNMGDYTVSSSAVNSAGVGGVRFVVNPATDGYFGIDSIKAYYPENTSEVTASISNGESITDDNEIILTFSNPIIDTGISADMFEIDGISDVITSVSADYSDPHNVIIGIDAGALISGEAYTLKASSGIVDIFGNSYSGGEYSFEITGEIVIMDDTVVMEDNLDSYEKKAYDYNVSSGSIKLDPDFSNWRMSYGELKDNETGSEYGNAFYFSATGHKLFTSNLGIDGSKKATLEFNTINGMTTTTNGLKLYVSANASDTGASNAEIYSMAETSFNQTEGAMGHTVITVEKENDSFVLGIWCDGVNKKTYTVTNANINAKLDQLRFVANPVSGGDYFAVDNFKALYPAYAGRLFMKEIVNQDTILKDGKIIARFNNPLVSSGIAAEDFSISGAENAITNVALDTADTRNVIIDLDTTVLSPAAEYTLNVGADTMSDVWGNYIKASAMTFETPKNDIGSISVTCNANPVEDISDLESGTLTANVTITNYDDSVLNTCLILAIYTTDDNDYTKLVALDYEEAALYKEDGETPLTATFDFTIAEDKTASDYVVKAFLWDGIGMDGTAMKPLLDAIQY